MRLYLSSFRMGDHPEYLAALVGDDSRRTVVIANAMDDAPEDIRHAGVGRELAALGELGFDAAELELRDYFDDEQRLRRELAGVALAWLRGGNVFMLRYALRRSGGDTVFRDLLADDALVYAGYSAGPCVLSPSLRGLEPVDDADAVMRIYGPNLSGRAWRSSIKRSSRTTTRRVTRDNGARPRCREYTGRGSPAPHPAGRAGAPHQRRERDDRVRLEELRSTLTDLQAARQARLGVAARRPTG